MSCLELPKKPAQVDAAQVAGRLVIVSNRVPVPTAAGEPAAGGLAVAVNSVLKENGGLWFGWSGGVCEDAEPMVRTQTVGLVQYAVSDLSRRDLDEYYHGFANRTLWPICHYRLDLAEHSHRHEEGYYRVNERFARQLAEMLRPTDIVWVHDYHFIPMADCLRRLGCANRIGFFLHIPWPSADVATALPNYERILKSFAAYDVVGFQTPVDVANFRSCLSGKAGRMIGAGWCEAYGRHFLAAAFPIGIETEAYQQQAQIAETSLLVKRTRTSLGSGRMVIGVDRLDYTKGLPQRIDAFSAFLRETPSALKNLTLLQIAPKTRSEVPEYGRIQREVAKKIGAVNGKFGEIDWTPVRYVNKTLSRTMLAGLYRMACIGLVTPLRDGMNLVAKEYVAAQSPQDPGVLILSRFAGAACELESALIVNPYDAEDIAGALKRAFHMPLAERKDRWRAMMDVLRLNSVEDWSARFLAALSGDPVPALVPLEPEEKAGMADPYDSAYPWSDAPPLWTSYGH